MFIFVYFCLSARMLLPKGRLSVLLVYKCPLLRHASLVFSTYKSY